VTRQRVKVALAGDGADEMLAGYRRYRFDLAEGALRSIAPSWLRRSTAGVAGWLYPKNDWLPRSLRAKATLENIARDDATAHLRSIALQAGSLPALLLRPEVRAQLSEYDPFCRGRELFTRCPSSNLLNRLLYVDMKTLLVDGILTKVDRASMAVGLEVRVPLLDHRLVQLAARMPASLKLNRTSDKFVLREVLRRWVGPTAAGRKKKGFDVPLDAWFRGPLREMSHDLLTSRDSLSRQWLKSDAIQRLIANHERGLRNHGPALWALLALELWARAYSPEATPRTHRAPAVMDHPTQPAEVTV
jgi:asparagine synthase (glutamine-hydrolysing)